MNNTNKTTNKYVNKLTSSSLTLLFCNLSLTLISYSLKYLLALAVANLWFLMLACKICFCWF